MYIYTCTCIWCVCVCVCVCVCIYIYIYVGTCLCVAYSYVYVYDQHSCKRARVFYVRSKICLHATITIGKKKGAIMDTLVTAKFLTDTFYSLPQCKTADRYQNFKNMSSSTIITSASTMLSPLSVTLSSLVM